ncbi:MAG TPA: hypothetical protein VEV41_00965 [Terriglobales bacterium]|nr:hypothetical protein [Terriglobales bacterium]
MTQPSLGAPAAAAATVDDADGANNRGAGDDTADAAGGSPHSLVESLTTHRTPGRGAFLGSPVGRWRARSRYLVPGVLVHATIVTKITVVI